VLGIRIRDGDIGNSLEPGGTKGRILDIEVPAETITELSHSYYTFRVFLRGETWRTADLIKLVVDKVFDPESDGFTELVRRAKLGSLDLRSLWGDP